jgi:hypothetical protein
MKQLLIYEWTSSIRSIHMNQHLLNHDRITWQRGMCAVQISESITTLQGGAGVAQHNKSPNQIQQVRPKIYSTEEEEKQIRLMGEEAHLQS